MPNHENAVLVDTSYLITLYKDSRDNHETAERYMRQLAEQKTRIILSTIVISEYLVRDGLPESLVRFADVVSFNSEHARLSAKFFSMIEPEARKGERTVCRDDIKLIAQAVAEKAFAIITADKRTMAKYIGAVASSGSPIRYIPVWEPYNAGIGKPDGAPELL